MPSDRCCAGSGTQLEWLGELLVDLPGVLEARGVYIDQGEAPRSVAGGVLCCEGDADRQSGSARPQAEYLTTPAEVAGRDEGVDGKA